MTKWVLNYTTGPNSLGHGEPQQDRVTKLDSLAPQWGRDGGEMFKKKRNAG